MQVKEIPKPRTYLVSEVHRFALGTQPVVLELDVKKMREAYGERLSLAYDRRKSLARIMKAVLNRERKLLAEIEALKAKLENKEQ